MLNITIWQILTYGKYYKNILKLKINYDYLQRF